MAMLFFFPNVEGRPLIQRLFYQHHLQRLGVHASWAARLRVCIREWL